MPAEASPARAMLRLGALWGGVLGAPVVVLGAMTSLQAGTSALIGVVVAVAALGVPPGLLALTGRVVPAAVMLIALIGGWTVVMGLALAYALLDAVPWLVGDRVGYALVAATVGSLGGQMRAVSRTRVLVYDESAAKGNPEQ